MIENEMIIHHSQQFVPNYEGLDTFPELTTEDRAILAKQYNKAWMLEWVAVAERYEWAENAPDTGSSAERWAENLNT